MNAPDLHSSHGLSFSYVVRRNQTPSYTSALMPAKPSAESPEPDGPLRSAPLRLRSCYPQNTPAAELPVQSAMQLPQEDQTWSLLFSDGRRQVNCHSTRRKADACIPKSCSDPVCCFSHFWRQVTQPCKTEAVHHRYLLPPALDMPRFPALLLIIWY